jgi:hypothetical protein
MRMQYRLDDQPDCCGVVILRDHIHPGKTTPDSIGAFRIFDVAQLKKSLGLLLDRMQELQCDDDGDNPSNGTFPVVLINWVVNNNFVEIRKWFSELPNTVVSPSVYNPNSGNHIQTMVVITSDLYEAYSKCA